MSNKKPLYLNDLYAKLGLTRNATPKDIEESYVRLKSTFEKDQDYLNLISITMAYKILTNIRKRVQYDYNDPDITRIIDEISRNLLEIESLQRKLEEK